MNNLLSSSNAGLFRKDQGVSFIVGNMDICIPTDNNCAQCQHGILIEHTCAKMVKLPSKTMAMCITAVACAARQTKFGSAQYKAHLMTCGGTEVAHSLLCGACKSAHAPSLHPFTRTRPS